jgi:hypothetical protein
MVPCDVLRPDVYDSGNARRTYGDQPGYEQDFGGWALQLRTLTWVDCQKTSSRETIA